jgi:hypothetical protein
MGMRRALIVGIDQYDNGSNLGGCVNDANKINRILMRNEGGDPNFECQVLLSPPDRITKSLLRHKIEELFKYDADVALLYYSGHGSKSVIDGYLIAQDTKEYNDGLDMHSILALADKAHIREIVIILDCCFSGTFGKDALIGDDKAILREGISILTASGASQTSKEVAGGGVFTTLIYDALEGGAADVGGNVSVVSVYAYVDQTLGAWDQRPMLKANVSKLISLRQCNPQIDIKILRKLPEYFHDPSSILALDPSFEPSVEPHNTENETIFLHLACYRDCRLLILVDAKSLFDAAINSKACRLTPLGKHYWRLANSGRL